MPVTITITGEDAAEALRHLRSLSDGIAPPLVFKAPPPATAPSVEQVAAAEARLAQPEPEETPAEETKKERKPRAKKETAAPSVPETPAEVKAQDEADEAAESTEAEVITLDDIRKIATAYVNKFGMEHAQKDLGDVLEKYTPGNRAISKIPLDDQALLNKVHAAFLTALEGKGA